MAFQSVSLRILAFEYLAEYSSIQYLYIRRPMCVMQIFQLLRM